MMKNKININNVKIFHIGYSNDTCKNKPENYELMDNSKNPRPDWFEYWPIRNFLLSTPLDDEKYYGFFSPKFELKTGYNSAKLFKTIHDIDDTTDVITICPQPEVGHLFKNIYYGSDFSDSGSLETCSKIFKSIGINTNLMDLVTDSRNTVFSNYIIAKKSYWLEWLSICEKIFHLSEINSDNELFESLNQYTNYGKGAKRKIFIIEGIATIILANKNYKVFNLNIDRSIAGQGNFYQENNESLLCDSLKIAYQETKNVEYLKLFENYSKDFIQNSIKRNQKAEANIMKQTPAHDKYNDSILHLLNSNQPKSVIEIGCMRGTLAKEYLNNFKECQWTGIDIDSDNIVEAKKYCNYTILGNIEELNLTSIPNISNAECWIFGDVLEHLRDPWRLLEKIREVSPSQTKIIACIPNSQHWSFQVRINAGMLDYQDDGLFDRTHLRFFSRETIIKMFVNAGYSIQTMHSRNFNFPGYEKYIPSIRTMASLTGIDPNQAEADAMAYQYVVEAKSL